MPKERRNISGRPQSPATDWDDVAQWYDQLVGQQGSEYHQHVVIPNTLRLLALHSGDPALDLACGQGVLCRTLHQLAVHVVGVDASRKLIEAARRHNATLDPKTAPLPVYHLADACDLSFLPANHFTAAACILALQNVHPIPAVAQSVSRLLKPAGRFVIVITHPCFRAPRQTSWGWDEQQKTQYRRVDGYLLPRKVPIVTHPGQSTQYTWTFHRPLQTYVKALRNAGLFIDVLEEWPSHKTSTSGPRAAAENTARKQIPMFLAIRAIKVSSLGHA